MTTAQAVGGLPETRALSSDDIKEALQAGWADFRAAPKFGLFFGGVFSVVGIVIAYMLMVQGTSYWVLPIAAGFPLIGPFAAVGLYEVSRRLHAGEPLDWSEILTVVVRKPGAQLPFYAFIVLFFYLVWVYLAHLVFALSFGLSPLTNVTSSFDILFTGPGMTMLILGTIVGAIWATVLFAISVMSVPMFLEREIDVVTAMITSVKVTLESRSAMIRWGLVIAAASAVAMLPLFLGMMIVFPVLSHASWHLYRKAVPLTA